MNLNKRMMTRIEKKFPGALEYIGKRLLICGSRDYEYRLGISMIISCFNPSVLINGCAPGADSIANEESRKYGIIPEEYPANWDRYGKSAGPIRNSEMLSVGKPDIVIAFYSGKRTNGTQDMVSKAKVAEVFTIELGLIEKE